MKVTFGRQPRAHTYTRTRPIVVDDDTVEDGSLSMPYSLGLTGNIPMNSLHHVSLRDLDILTVDRKV